MEIMTNYVNPKRRKIEKSTNGTLIFTKMIDFLDDLCENIDVNMDKMKGIGNIGENLRVVNRNDLSRQDQMKEKSKKPQNYFSEKIDNSHTPFIPRIKVKHHAKHELCKEIVKANKDPESYFKLFTDKFEHPYEKEIDEFEVPEWALSLEVEPDNPGVEVEDNFVYVESWSALKKMMQHLESVNEIAIDLEHHSYRSYQGITCLIQISTREKDFVVDTIALRDHLHILNSVTSDPSKVKVLHGARMDVKWLQRDFGVYIVNLFDTYHAVSRLGKSPFTLASLLFRYTKKTTDKQYQLADWRIRPLTEKMMKYARRDTHYLLYIYDCLRVDIINYSRERKLDPVKELANIWNKSNDVCLLQYRKPVCRNRTFYNLLNNQKSLLTEEKIEIFKALWEWRNKMARVEDESTGYILPNNLLCKLSLKPPNKIQDVLNLRKRIPEKVKKSAKDILRVVEDVKKRFNIEEKEFEEKKNLKRAKKIKIGTGAKGVFVNEDNNVKMLRFEFKAMKVEEEEEKWIDDSEEENMAIIDFLAQDGLQMEPEDKISSIKSGFNYPNYIGYLNEIYPEMKEKMNFKKQQDKKNKKEGKEGEGALQHVDTNDVMEFTKSGADDGKQEGSSIDISKILNNSIIPKSLRERFGVVLQSKAAKKRYKDGIRRKKNKKKIKMATLQTPKNNNMLLDGNVFEALRKDKIKNESAFNQDREQGNGFSDKLELVEQNMLKGKKKKRNDVDFGLYQEGNLLRKKINKGKGKGKGKGKKKKKARFAKSRASKFKFN